MSLRSAGFGLGIVIIAGMLLAGLATARQPAAAQAPVETPTPTVAPTAAPTLTVRQVCQEGLATEKCALRVWDEYHWGVIFLGIALIVISLVLSFFGGVREAIKTAGQRFTNWIGSLLRASSNPTHQYLLWFINHYQDPKFGALSLGLYEREKPATLKEIYLPIPVVFDLTEQERELSGKDTRRGGRPPEAFALGLQEGKETIGLVEALKRSSVLAIEGIAGSGKSTLLQWVGMICAQAMLKQEIKGQKELLAALGGSLFPIFIPLGAFDRFCQKNEREPSAAAMLDFVTDWYKQRCETQRSKSTVPPLPDEFFANKLKNGSLLLFDGVDEVAPGQRLAVRRAVQEILTIHAHPRTHTLITARPSASAEAQTDNARRGRMLPLDETQRDQLIRSLYRFYDRPNAEGRSDDLIQRLNASEEDVRKLAETPLLTTIFTIIHRPGHELPNQRAEVYDNAIETLLRDLHRKDSHEIGSISDPDSALLRSRLALIAFQLHLAGVGEEGKPENDLIDLLLKDFSTTATEPQLRRKEISEFLCAIAVRGGLIEEQDCAFGFRTHRTFQEFLAGWHLVMNYAAYDLERQADFITQHLTEDNWVEPIRLAAGYLAVRGENQAKVFVQKLAGLGKTRRERDYAIALAGLCLADLPAQATYRELRESLPAQMLDALQRKHPTLPVRLRFDIGLALGSLKDPSSSRRLFDRRLHPSSNPEMVCVASGPFRMGTSQADEEKLKAAGVDERYIFAGEKTGAQDRIVSLSAYEIGKYPVSNAEYRAFVAGNGYGDLTGARPAWWSEAGWKWRGGEWESDLTIYPEETQQTVRSWLANRPVERRSQPFWWDDPRWNANNLPVVGVCWFETEAYAKWLSQMTGNPYRLPTEAEWERAARGVEGYLWPWGDEWDAARCNNSEPEDGFGRTSPMGIYPHGASPCGALDMVGNVWEWCWDWYAQDTYAQSMGNEVIDPRGPETGEARVLRGGSWDDNRNYARCAYRFRGVPDDFDFNVGFRLVRSPNWG